MLRQRLHFEAGIPVEEEESVHWLVGDFGFLALAREMAASTTFEDLVLVQELEIGGVGQVDEMLLGPSDEAVLALGRGLGVGGEGVDDQDVGHVAIELLHEVLELTFLEHIGCEDHGGELKDLTQLTQLLLWKGPIAILEVQGQGD